MLETVLWSKNQRKDSVWTVGEVSLPDPAETAIFVTASRERARMLYVNESEADVRKEVSGRSFFFFF